MDNKTLKQKKPLNQMTPVELSARLGIVVGNNAIEETKSILEHIANNIKISLDINETLDLAISNENKEIVELLLKQVEKYSLSIDTMIIFETAKMSQSTAIISLLFDKIGQDLSSDYKGVFLEDASRQGNYEVADQLLKIKENDISPSALGQSLKLAMGNKHPYIVELLLNNKDTEIPFADKELALNLAINTKQSNIAESLLSKICENLSGNAKELLLLSVAKNGPIHIAELLLDLGISTTAKQLALKMAYNSEQTEIVELLTHNLEEDILSQDVDALMPEQNDEIEVEYSNQAPDLLPFNDQESTIEVTGDMHQHIDL